MKNLGLYCQSCSSLSHALFHAICFHSCLLCDLVLFTILMTSSYMAINICTDPKHIEYWTVIFVFISKIDNCVKLCYSLNQNRLYRWNCHKVMTLINNSCLRYTKTSNLIHRNPYINKSKKIWNQPVNLDRIASTNNPKVVLCACFCTGFSVM